MAAEPLTVLLAAHHPAHLGGLDRLLPLAACPHRLLCPTRPPDLPSWLAEGPERLLLWAADSADQALAALAVWDEDILEVPVVLAAPGWSPEQEHQALSHRAQEVVGLEGLEAPELARHLRLAQARWRPLARQRQRGERYRSIVESQTELVCRYQPDGTITFANPAYCHYMRGTPDKILGSNLYRKLSDDESRRLKALFAGFTPRHPLARTEHSHTTSRGETRWQKWTSQGIFDPQGRLREIQSVGLDITERKLMEEALQVVETNLRQLILNNADGMIVANQLAEVLFVNPAAERLLGRRGSQALGEALGSPREYGKRREMTLENEAGQKVVVEVRVVETKWQDQPALLASLHDITELVELREELRALSLEDQLTGLYNRRGFLTLAQQQVKTAQRMGRRLHLFFVDVDNLKTINDRLGHAQGDRVLWGASQVLKNTFRESDIVARVGGDEFAALALENENDLSVPVLRRLEINRLAWISQPDWPFDLSLSVGNTIYDPFSPRPLEELMEEADRLMYAHKRGKACPPPILSQA